MSYSIHPLLLLLGLMVVTVTAGRRLSHGLKEGPSARHGVGPSSVLKESSDEQVVKDYVENNFELTFREPNGTLIHKYLVPGGPYDQEWDWDSVFTGVALLDLGAGEVSRQERAQKSRFGFTGG